MSLNAKHMNSSETSSLITRYVNSDEKKLLIENAPKKQLEELLLSHISIDCRLYSKATTVNQHLHETNRMYTSTPYNSDTAGNTIGLGCVGMPIEKFIVTKSSDVDFKSVCEIANCVKDNENVIEIFYFDRKKEFWVIVLDNQYSKYKEIIKSCRKFEESYKNFEYLVLRKDQIDVQEMPQTNIELKRDVDE